MDTVKLPESGTAPDLYTEPAWDVALLFPAQGAWTETDYLELKTNRLVEFSHGKIEVLPMPTRFHQMIVGYLYIVLRSLATRGTGIAMLAPFRLQLWSGKFREPDLLFLRDKKDSRNQEAYWTGADLVMEVVSPDDPKRDLVDKRREYAQAQIPEYWIIHPQTRTITVFQLDGQQYREYGTFGQGEIAISATVPELKVAVEKVFES